MAFIRMAVFAEVIQGQARYLQNKVSEAVVAKLCTSQMPSILSNSISGKVPYKTIKQ